ncbi:thioredoxin [Caproiciproducens sp. LBM24188]
MFVVRKRLNKSVWKRGYVMSVVMITQDNFKSEVLDSEKPVLVDFWASWCGPCRMVSPIVDEIAEESDGSFKVGKINVDEQPDLAAQFNVMSIPTLMVFKNGTVADSTVGVRSKQDILSMIQQA